MRPAKFGAMPPVTINPTPPRARGVERGQLVEAVARLFETRMHRAHQHAIAKGREPEVEWCEQVRVRVHAARFYGDAPQRGAQVAARPRAGSLSAIDGSSER